MRDHTPPDEVEKRDLIMFKCLQHDWYEILTNSPSTAGTRILAVQLKRRQLMKAWNLTAVAGTRGCWYGPTRRHHGGGEHRKEKRRREKGAEGWVRREIEAPTPRNGFVVLFG